MSNEILYRYQIYNIRMLYCENVIIEQLKQIKVVVKLSFNPSSSLIQIRQELTYAYYIIN